MRLKAVLLLGMILVVLLSIGLFTQSGLATVDNAKQTKKACTFCHVKIGNPELNDAGKYYKVKRTLEGYEAKNEKK